MISQNTSEALGPPTRGPGADPAAPQGAPPAGKACASSRDAAAPERGRGKLFTWPLIIGIIVTAALVVGSLFVGAYDIFGNEDGAEMFQITRVPRAIALVLAGAAMGMCGLLMQLITQNRFVEPTTTGTTEWAGLGLLLVMVVFPGSAILPQMIGAIITAFVGTMVFFAFIQKVTLKSSVIVPIVGMMLGAVVGGVSTYVGMATDMLQSLQIWFQGSFTSVLEGQYEPLWAVTVVVIVVFIVADRFTVAGLGEEVATNVGLNYRAIMLLGTGLVAVATGIITVVVGNLPFLGLIVPNLVSMFRGDDLRSNLPWVCIVGIMVVTVCDLIGRTIIHPFEIPVSTILAVVGTVVFTYMLMRQRKAEG